MTNTTEKEINEIFQWQKEWREKYPTTHPDCSLSGVDLINGRFMCGRTGGMCNYDIPNKGRCMGDLVIDKLPKEYTRPNMHYRLRDGRKW